MYQNDGSHLIVCGDYFGTLKNCEGFYDCPVDSNGNPIGPLVGYSGSYVDDRGLCQRYVGLRYFNFSKADIWSAVLTFFAEAMAEKLRARGIVPTIILGAPWAGVKFSQEVARLLECRHIFAQKEELIEECGGRKYDRFFLGRYEDVILPGDKVMIGEELVNNFSATGALCELVREADASVIGVHCAINRSYPFVDALDFDGVGIPVVGVLDRETPQYRQDHPLVACAVREGRVVWEPKYSWERLRQVMA